MELGNIVEYIDRQKILCAVVLEVKNQRLRLLTETNREVNLSASRLLHRDKNRLDLSMGRSRMVDALKEVADKRRALIGKVAIRDLWEVLNTEQEWIDLETMTDFCFPDSANGDHQAAVIRALFDDRLYFKFNPERFFPNTEEQVQRIAAQRDEEARRQRILDSGGDWLRQLMRRGGPETIEPPAREFVDVLRSYYLFGKEAQDHALARGMMERAGLSDPDALFPILVGLGVFAADENLELLRLETPVAFPPAAERHAAELVRSGANAAADCPRQDLTGLNLFTIDGQSTLDFDDALSLEATATGYRLGVHIVDVAHIVRKGDPIDVAARERGSSIYMADRKIPMLPAALAEGLCSLRAGEIRPAISTMVEIGSDFALQGVCILPSFVRVRSQLTYFDVNSAADQDPQVITLRGIAQKFREQRLAAGAVHISVPEINLWLGENGEVHVSRINRESPGRMLVAELMIMANWLTARFLATHGMPAVFRSQPDPRERLYRGEQGSLFQHWMQRRLINRFVLGRSAEKHSGLGLDAYVTATSPIRKYFDLVTQRQVRAALGLEEPYLPEEVDQIIQMLEFPMSRVFKLQNSRQRYWLLKHLEQRVGQKLEAIVLVRRRHSYQLLLTDYMLECDLPIAGFLDLKPEDLVQVTLQKVDARKDLVALTIG
ncbi:MAG: RNB domain-containing ribonuclease [Desulfobacterales bacterium]|jgi:exoribonuclease-2|nr:RNB domain-containing ribonuclease [Desulfobacterales bacterium]